LVNLRKRAKLITNVSKLDVSLVAKLGNRDELGRGILVEMNDATVDLNECRKHVAAWTENVRILGDQALTLGSDVRPLSPSQWWHKPFLYSFAKNCAHAISLSKILPSEGSGRTLHDLSSAAALTRCIVDTYFMQLYLARVAPGKIHEEARRLVWNHHSLVADISLNKPLWKDECQHMAKKRARETSINCLRANSAILSLTPPIRSKIEDGKQARLEDEQQLCMSDGINHPSYKMVWRWLSAHVHAHAFATDGLSEFSANDTVSLNKLVATQRTACGYLAKSIECFVRVFPESVKLVPMDITQKLTEWTAMLAEEPRTI